MQSLSSRMLGTVAMNDVQVVGVILTPDLSSIRCGPVQDDAEYQFGLGLNQVPGLRGPGHGEVVGD